MLLSLFARTPSTYVTLAFVTNFTLLLRCWRYIYFIIAWLCGSKMSWCILLYLLLWMKCDDQIWTGGTSLGDESMEVSFPGSGDVITAWSRNFEKSLFLQF